MPHQPEPAPRILPSLSHEDGTPLDSARRSQVLGFAVIRSAIMLERGLILISGRKGTGKTVLLCNALRFAAERGRSVRFENLPTLRYREPGVPVCHTDKHPGTNFMGTFQALKAGEPVESVIGVQTSIRYDVGNGMEIMVERLAHLAFMAQSRLVIVEFSLRYPLSDQILEGMNTILSPQGIPLHAIHLQADDEDLDAAPRASAVAAASFGLDSGSHRSDPSPRIHP